MWDLDPTLMTSFNCTYFHRVLILYSYTTLTLLFSIDTSKTCGSPTKGNCVLPGKKQLQKSEPPSCAGTEAQHGVQRRVTRFCCGFPGCFSRGSHPFVFPMTKMEN